MKSLITRTITGIIFVGIIVATFFLPPVFYSIIFLPITLLGVWEYLQIAGKKNVTPQYLLPFLISIVVFIAFQQMQNTMSLSLVLFMIAIVLMVSLPVVELFRKKENPTLNIAVSLFPLLWITMPFSIAGLWFQDSASVVLSLFIIIWLNDSLAYCAGSLLGKHKLFERISPKKSWEGFLAALILTATASAFFIDIPYFQNSVFTERWHWFGFTMLVIIAGTFGDLVESLFKRDSSVKDSGNILPGHGGILDRFDSFLLAAPVGFAYWKIIELLCL